MTHGHFVRDEPAKRSQKCCACAQLPVDSSVAVGSIAWSFHWEASITSQMKQAKPSKENPRARGASLESIVHAHNTAVAKLQASTGEQRTMKEKETSQNMSDKEKMPFADMADQAMKNYEQALRSGLRMQEEASRFWTGLLSQNQPSPDWQKSFQSLTAAARSMYPANQKRMEEMLDLAEKNSQAGAELVKKAVGAAQTPAIADSQSKWLDVFSSSLSAARSNTEALSQISCRAIDSWIDLLQKGD
jgi:hypothetical protein